MSAAAEATTEKPKKGKLKFILLGVGVLALLGAGGWFAGIIPGLGHKEHAAEQSGKEAKSEPVFLDVPEIIANMNAGNRRAAYIKLHAKFELARKEDQAIVQAAMPRVVDLFQG